MLTIDGAEARCLTCGSIDLEDTGYDYLIRFRTMSRFVCNGCGVKNELHDIVTRQHLAPASIGPRARTTDPDPSHIAAQLPFDGRQRQVVEALLALGRADADQITDWVNARHDETQRSATSKRLGELVALNTVTQDGTHRNHRGRVVGLYRLTEIARRQAA